MNVYTAHLRPRRPPVLVREGFAWGALVFGPLWLLAQRAWIAGVLALCADVLIALIPADNLLWPLHLALAWALGLFGHDLVRWSLARRGYLLAHVVAAGDADAAFARLLARRPDLAADTRA
ncbi:MAG: DUF2628 domain-containing protein [Rhodospirillales bacterium]|nr:DUF2628 domain-containing protein [Rhodospirillales bacterium]